MLTRELVGSLFDIKDGEFYHKPKSEVDGRSKEWNRRYAGKKARLSRIDELYLKYKDKVDTRVWNAIRSDIWCA